MFLDITCRRNPNLIKAAVELHQKGQIEPNTYVMDLDAVEGNARLIAEAARVSGLSLYFMTKQVNRNPQFAKAVAGQGIPKAVAVDWDEALTLHQNGIAIGHVGHLVQVPENLIGSLLSVGPEVLTVFSVDKAAQIASEARRLGLEQPILLRVVGEADQFFPGQVGGIPEGQLREAALAIARLDGVRIAGVTSFPCLIFDEERGRAVPSNNMGTLRRAARLLRTQLGLSVEQVNAPGMTAAGTISLLAEEGATHGEPGHGLTGTTPLHACSVQPETPAIIYVSEVSHIFGGKIYCYGGGFYPRSRARRALIGRLPEDIFSVHAAFEGISADNIDYYGCLVTENRSRVEVGDTVIFAFRAQMFTSRSSLALVRGVATEKPQLVALYDQRGQRRQPHG